MSKRILHLLSLILGLLGLVACVAAIVATWSVDARVNQASEKVFGAVDKSLVAVQQRITQTHDRVQALQITAEGIGENLKKWTGTEARERFSSRLGVEDKAEHLASGLEQADHLLELTESSLQLAQQALGAGSSLGFPVQTDPADHLLAEIVSLRAQLTQAIEPVERILERAAEDDDENSLAARLSQIAQLTVRVIATLTEIDSGLEKLGSRLTELQANVRAAKVTVRRWIRIAAIGVTLLIGWMAAGQGSLCYLGWQGWCRQRPDHRPRSE